jgi:TRAP-type C4-dicarboxylate transport system substrate-binding protein
MISTRRFVLAALMVGACQACSPPPAKSGGVIAPVTLHSLLPAPTGNHQPGDDLLEAIGRLVKASSNGAVTIATKPGAESNDMPGDVLAQVGDGRIDLGIVRASRFALAGVTTFQALQAPFVVDNEALAERVASDPIAKEMMSGLDRLGVVGLAIVPSGLRHPIAYNRQLVSLADYQGAMINTSPSLEVAQLIAAFGATPDYSVGGERLAKVADGSLTGIEASLWQDVGIYPATLTGNVVLFSKFDVVIINKTVFDALSKAQRSVLQQAVQAAVPVTLADRTIESEAAKDWCRLRGSRVVLASSQDLADLQGAATSVRTTLEQDPFTRRMIDRILQLSVGTVKVDVQACEPPATSDVMIEPHGDQTVIDGVWRLEVDYDALVAADIPGTFPQFDEGVWNFDLEGGQGTATASHGTVCGMAYFIDGDRISLSFEADPTKQCGGLLAGTFGRHGDELTLLFTDAAVAGDVKYNTAFFKNGLHRIGDVRASS